MFDFDINRLRELYTLGGGIENYGMTDPTFQDPGTMPNQSPIQTPQTQSASMEDDISMLNKFYTPQYASRDRFNSLLSNMPQRNDNISTGRKLVAGGMGLDARQRVGTPGQEFTARGNPIETMEKVMHAPYIRDVMAWKEQLDPQYKAAELENRSNINERTLAGNLVTSRAQDRRLESNERIANQKNEQAIVRNRISEMRVRLGRGFTFTTTGPTVMAHNSTTGESVDTGISTGRMSEEDRISLQNEGRIEAARVTGESAAGRINQSGTNIFQGPDGKRYRPDAEGNLVEVQGGPAASIYKPGTTPKPGAGNTLESNRARNNRLAEAYQTDPTNKEWIKSNGVGLYDFKPKPRLGQTKPGTSTFGFGGQVYEQKDLDRYDAFRQEMDPNYIPSITTPNTGFGSSNSSGNNQPAQKDKTVIKKEYSESRKSTRITYSDGTTEVVQGRR